MPTPAITPTVTHQVRTFLNQQGLALEPWSGLDETYRQLYGLLRRRRDDPAFWEPLSGLLRSIVDNATEDRAGRLPAPDAELLRSWDIDLLLRDLRAALPRSAEPATAVAFASQLAAPVMGAFLILGLVASGCSAATPTGADADQVADTGADAEVDADQERPAWVEGCSLSASTVLYQTIDESTLDDWTKGRLCQCFTRLNTDWNDGLTELFGSSSAEEVAAALSEMMECCDYDQGALSRDFDESREQLLNGNLCFIALPYRGVAFPRRQPE